MSSFFGFGTMYFGRVDYDERDQSFTATKWFIFLHFPVFPIRADRIRMLGTSLKGTPLLFSFVSHFQVIKKEPLSRNWKHIARVYGAELALVAMFGMILARMPSQNSDSELRSSRWPVRYPCSVLHSDYLCGTEAHCRWDRRATACIDEKEMEGR